MIAWAKANAARRQDGRGGIAKIVRKFHVSFNRAHAAWEAASK